MTILKIAEIIDEIRGTGNEVIVETIDKNGTEFAFGAKFIEICDMEFLCIGAYAGSKPDIYEDVSDIDSVTDVLENYFSIEMADLANQIIDCRIK